MIQYLPIFLADTARAWLEYLPSDTIHSWSDLQDVFVGNFQATYERPGNSWDLKNCWQKTDESLRDYVRRFSKRCNELPDVDDADVIGAFLSGTTCETLVHKLGCLKPRTVSELLDVATRHASGEDAVDAIFNKAKGKARVDDGEPASSRPNTDNNKKNKSRKRRNDVNVVAVADRPNNTRAKPTSDDKEVPKSDLFDKLCDQPCPYHGKPVNHTFRNCNTIKKILRVGGSQPPDPKGKGKAPSADQDEEQKPFPDPDGCLMIFGGPDAYGSKRDLKITTRQVNAVEPAVPTYLRWSESAITFDRADHPDLVPQPGRFPLVVDPVVGRKRLSKVLMDGGSGLNILYVETLEGMNISRSRLRPSASPFHGVVPGKQALPLGQIDLPVTFGTRENFRTETLTFEVVDFPGTYHAILGRPCYAKFMAVPNYTYLKLKMPGPKGIITVGTRPQHALQCEQESCHLASALIASAELLLAQARGEIPQVAPDFKPSTSGSFKSADDLRTVSVDPQDPKKTLQIGTALPRL
jgi:hypothetical protein